MRHVVLLHGLFSNGAFFSPLVEELGRHGMSAAALDAEPRPISILRERVVPAWCDIVSHDVDGPVDVEGTRAAIEAIDGEIDKAVRQGWRESDIFVGGFSQGGYVALCHCLASSRQLGGTFAFGTYLPAAAIEAFARHRSRPGGRLLVGHGAEDIVLPPQLAATTVQRLELLGFDVDASLALPMSHELSPEAHRLIVNWLGLPRPGHDKEDAWN